MLILLTSDPLVFQPWLLTDPETNVTFANTNPTCRREWLSLRSPRGAELEMHLLKVFSKRRLTSRRIAQWTVMMTKPWTESKTAKRTWRRQETCLLITEQVHKPWIQRHPFVYATHPCRRTKIQVSSLMLLWRFEEYWTGTSEQIISGFKCFFFCSLWKWN